MDKKQLRPISSIAKEIKWNWLNVYFGAVPYLDAMMSLESIDEMYGADSAKSVVLYFLANASTWRGDIARRIKKELNELVKS